MLFTNKGALVYCVKVSRKYSFPDLHADPTHYYDIMFSFNLFLVVVFQLSTTHIFIRGLDV